MKRFLAIAAVLAFAGYSSACPLASGKLFHRFHRSVSVSQVTTQAPPVVSTKTVMVPQVQTVVTQAPPVVSTQKTVSRTFTPVYPVQRVRAGVSACINGICPLK